MVPPWQSPDELAHFGFAQSLAENFTIPHTAGAPQASSDLTAANGAVGADRGAFWPTPAPPDWRRSDYSAYLAAEHAAPPSRSDGTGPSTATNNPPLYYLVAAAAYLIGHGGTPFGQLYSIRIFGVLLLIVTTIAAWLLAGEVFGRRRLPQLGCAAVAGLLPMASFMSTAVNPDALVITLWTLVLWLGARVINHRAQGVGCPVAMRGDRRRDPHQGLVLRARRTHPAGSALRLAAAPGRRASSRPDLYRRSGARSGRAGAGLGGAGLPPGRAEHHHGRLVPRTPVPHQWGFSATSGSSTCRGCRLRYRSGPLPVFPSTTSGCASSPACSGGSTCTCRRGSTASPPWPRQDWGLAPSPC